MTHINLIAAERRGAKAPARTFDLTQKVTLIGTVLLLVTVLLAGWRYWALTEAESRLAQEIEAARREEARLAELLKQVAEFEARRAQLQERVALIDELRRGQTAPVHMVDQISRSLPEMTWLLSLKQEGYDITMQGRSTTLAALSDFVGNLEGTKYFKRPVEIVESEVVQGQQGAPDLIGFTIKATFQMRGIETAPAAKPGAKGAAAKGGKVG